MSQHFYHINDSLVVKFLLGEASKEEKAHVEAWINTNAENKKNYDDFSMIWEESKTLAVISTVDEVAAWKRFKSLIQHKSQGKEVARKFSPPAWLRVAATIILIAGAGYLSYRVFSDKPEENIFVYSQDRALTDTLPDGSIATLNKNSSLSYPSKFTGDTRSIALKGEAFFDVTPNKDKAFVVRAKDVLIKVAGTSFNVRNVNDVTEIIVETGIVLVTHNHKTVQLRPFEGLKVSQQYKSMQKEIVSDKLYNYYRTKEFVCDDTPLWKLVEVLNDAYGANIFIGRKELRNLRLNTTFNNESLDNILVVISETFGLSVTKENDRITLK